MPIFNDHIIRYLRRRHMKNCGLCSDFVLQNCCVYELLLRAYSWKLNSNRGRDWRWYIWTCSLHVKLIWKCSVKSSLETSGSEIGGIQTLVPLSAHNQNVFFQFSFCWESFKGSFTLCTLNFNIIVRLWIVNVLWMHLANYVNWMAGVYGVNVP